MAAELFNRGGYHAVGIDRVIEEAGIAKTTLYRHFASKDELIIAVLKQIDEKFRDSMQQYIEARDGDAREKILASFDFLEKWFETDSFFGCPFISAAAEFGDQPNVVFQEASTHKRLVIAYLEQLAREINPARAKELALEINILLEGAIAVAQITQSSTAARTAKAVAEKILRRPDQQSRS
ncbi:MAG: TetR/AcrR family transcriptional regulator [Sneathiella sp.]|nr:TetR/AcrR family transcriptional regulator [Sneathiella sp.]